MRNISAIELAEWQAYYQLEPVGEERDDWRIAALMALTRDLVIDPKKDKSLPPADFLLQFGQEKSRDGLIDKIKALAKAFGGEVKRNQ